MKAVKSKGSRANPDQIKLSLLQAERLGAMSEIAAKELVGLTVAEISDKFRFRIDPMLFFFRKVCGKVVKKDPSTGVEYPVPYATVYVEDTDCSLLGFFPQQSKWGWYFPFRCRREVIAIAQTDECGRFCVWIPRWDIDWVLRFRSERHCFPIIFERPSIRDILDDLIPEKIPFPFPEPDPRVGPKPGPGPDPAPFVNFDRGSLISLIENTVGRDVAGRLDRVIASPAVFGASNVEMHAALNGDAFEHVIPPPLPLEMRINSREQGMAENIDMEMARSSLATRLKFDAAELKGFNPQSFIGPFKRCYDVLVPEWVPIIDVPDITFRVMQDTDGDGDEETIYSEGYFQVRWNASGPIPDVKINAMPNARAGKECGEIPVPCGNTPAIVLAGRMPVVNVPTVYNALTGYALRPNRPHPSGLFLDTLPNPNAATPFYGAISLLGCLNSNTKVPATQYRITYKYSSDGGSTFTSPTPFVGLTWPLFRLDGGGNPEWHYPTPDGNGWYPIALPAGPNPFLPQNLLLDWPTYAYANGRYVLTLEMGTGGVVSASSAEVAFNIDNSYPQGPLTIEWRKASGGAFQLLTYPCPLVRRGVVPVDLEFRVTLQASAAHMRSAQLFASGCGGGNFSLISGTTAHWHTSTVDNAVTLQAVFGLSAGTLEGTYSFSAHVASRAMNPNGGDGGHLLLPNPWEYDPDDIHINPSFSFSVINAS